jgi:hypothetical protein
MIRIHSKVYPSFDVINILEAKSLRFIQATALENKTRRNDGIGCVQCVASDLDLNLVGTWVSLYGQYSPLIYNQSSSGLREAKLLFGRLLRLFATATSFVSIPSFRTNPMCTLCRLAKVCASTPSTNICEYLILMIGLLAVAGSDEVTVYSLDSEQDLPTWSQTCKFG